MGGVTVLNAIPQPRWLFNCLLSGFVLVATVTALKDVKIPRWIVKSGDVSFSFYLIHYYVIVAAGKLFDFQKPSVKAWIGVAVVLVVSELLAFLSYHIVEIWLGKKLLALLPEKKEESVSRL